MGKSVHAYGVAIATIAMYTGTENATRAGSLLRCQISATHSKRALFP